MLNQFILFSQYNRLMNQRLYTASAQLPEASLRKDCRVFFKSLLGTLNHIMVGDIIWLKRFAPHPASTKPLSYISCLEKPKTLDAILFDNFKELREEREKIDHIIIDWIDCLSEDDIKGGISYQNMTGDTFHKPYASLISHLFLHQVHHRGQATGILSQFGLDFGDTDLIEIIPDNNT